MEATTTPILPGLRVTTTRGEAGTVLKVRPFDGRFFLDCDNGNLVWRDFSEVV